MSQARTEKVLELISTPCSLPVGGATNTCCKQGLHMYVCTYIYIYIYMYIFLCLYRYMHMHICASSFILINTVNMGLYVDISTYAERL